MAKKVLSGGEIQSLLNEISGISRNEPQDTGKRMESGSHEIRSSMGKQAGLEEILASTRLGIIITDQYGRIRKWNQRAGSLLGSSLTGNWNRMVSRLSAHPETFTWFMCGLAESGAAEDNNHPLLTEDGVLNLRVAARVLKDMTDQVLGTIFILDIRHGSSGMFEQEVPCHIPGTTDLWQLEMALRQSEQAFQNLAEEQAVASVFILQEGLFVFANSRSERLFGQAEEDLLGTPFTRFTGNEENGVDDEFSALENGSIGCLQQEMVVDLDDDRRVLELTALRTQYRNTPALIGSVVDITEQKIITLCQDYLLLHDLETGLPNKKLFDVTLPQALERCERYERLLGLIHIRSEENLPQSSDRVPLLSTEAGNRLKKVLRKPDLACRISRNGFMIILENLQSRRDVSLVAARILRVLNGPYTLNEMPENVVWRMGLSVYPFDGKTTTELLRKTKSTISQA